MIKHNKQHLRIALSGIVAVTMLGVFCLSFFYEGTSIAKFLVKKNEMERVNEAPIEAYTEGVLFGDAKVEVDEETLLESSADSEQGFIVSQRIRFYDRWVLAALTAASLLLLIPSLQRLKWLNTLYPVISIYLLMMAMCKVWNGGSMFAHVSHFAHTTRWMAPFALWLWITSTASGQSKRLELAYKAVLIVAVSLTFATHGVEAYMLNPPFSDLLYGGTELVGVSLTEAQNYGILRAIGIMDLCLAAMLLFSRDPRLLLWMCFWGTMTALSRPLVFGSEMWLEAVLRVANGGLPLLLYFIYRKEKEVGCITSSSTETSDSNDCVSVAQS